MSKKNATERQPEANGDAEQFDRFEQLTRQLLAVPKQEAKEEAEKARAKRARKNARKNNR